MHLAKTIFECQFLLLYNFLIFGNYTDQSVEESNRPETGNGKSMLTTEEKENLVEKTIIQTGDKSTEIAELTLPNCGRDLNSNSETNEERKRGRSSPSLVLPPIVAKSHSKTDCIPTACKRGSDKPAIDLHLPSIFNQLEMFSFSDHEIEEDESFTDSDDDDCDDDESYSGTGHTYNDREDDELHDEKYASLQTAVKQPGPAILKYVRESESLYYSYFSIQNKEAVDKRIADARARSPGPRGPGSDESDSFGACSSMNSCQFCGKSIPRLSLLKVIQEDGTDKGNGKVNNLNDLSLILLLKIE